MPRRRRRCVTGLTATPGADFTPVSGVLTFGAGETSKTFTIPILDDPATEGDELVQVSLGSPTGGERLIGRNHRPRLPGGGAFLCLLRRFEK